MSANLLVAQYFQRGVGSADPPGAWLLTGSVGSIRAICQLSLHAALGVDVLLAPGFTVPTSYHPGAAPGKAGHQVPHDAQS